MKTLIISLLLATLPFAACSFGGEMPAAGTNQAAEQMIDKANAQSVRDDAVTRVKAIVNQPARKFPERPGMRVSRYSPGWFHEGAAKPDFKNVDVRATQELSYTNMYVSSDLNPGVVFLGAELEFNSMTKYFYEDRSLPKKKLTQAEMLEINRLYRVIGKCDELLAPAPVGETPESAGPAEESQPAWLQFLSGHKTALVGGGVALLVVVVVFGFLGRRRSA